jgi:hypothetical protein
MRPGMELLAKVSYSAVSDSMKAVENDDPARRDVLWHALLDVLELEDRLFQAKAGKENFAKIKFNSQILDSKWNPSSVAIRGGVAPSPPNIWGAEVTNSLMQLGPLRWKIFCVGFVPFFTYFSVTF